MTIDPKVLLAMQRHAAAAEVERLRLVGELDAMCERAEKAEAQLASISGVTRLELVAAERAKRDGLLAALKELADIVAGHVEDGDPLDSLTLQPARAAIAAAEAAP